MARSWCAASTAVRYEAGRIPREARMAKKTKKAKKKGAKKGKSKTGMC
jgi:hypothetical protein